MRIGVEAATGSGGMKHSESMHNSHHGQAGLKNMENSASDIFTKTENVNKNIMYNEKAKIVSK